MIIKKEEVKTAQSFKTFVLQFSQAKKRTLQDALVEIMDGTIYFSPDTENSHDANKNYGNYRKYSFVPTDKLTIEDVGAVCIEIGVTFDNYDQEVLLSKNLCLQKIF